jgi:hypothetical protein
MDFPVIDVNVQRQRNLAVVIKKKYQYQATCIPHSQSENSTKLIKKTVLIFRVIFDVVFDKKLTVV